MFDTIQQLKEKHNAVILAHYYQEPEIQDMADFVGDSLELSRKAAATDADVILFCGVHFMAETAKIVNPNKKVIIPDMDAGCSLADSAPADSFKEWIEQHPDHIVISYINCSADVKALSDIICTSANAKKVVESIPKHKKILFAPDRFLGKYVMKETGRDMVLWNGSCQVHEIFSEKALIELKVKHPQAQVVAHPECDENILIHADFIGSTSALIKHVNSSSNQQYIIGTEPGVIHQMQKNNLDKKFIPLPSNTGCACNECPHMRLNTMEKIVQSLENLEHEITLDEEVRVKALKPLNRMLEIV
ncbi:MAG: quinolinate synthase [Candidatus Marinimicrobia bacterium]|nr:quinolinate synthase [Candidatus Neomarinimicrobiota bacterium]|tara:strand:+ start:21685 stop:22596 length:912 start_codon:yes stop_codon:yes gene_type:complete